MKIFSVVSFWALFFAALASFFDLPETWEQVGKHVIVTSGMSLVTIIAIAVWKHD